MSAPASQSQISDPPSLKTGELFVQEGLITPEDISKVLSLQNSATAMATSHHLFGILLCHLNLITPVDNYCTLFKFNKLLGLKEFFLSRNLPEKDLSLVYKESEKQDIPVITALIRSRIMSADSLQKALFHLYHIPFRTIKGSVYEGKKTGPLKQVIPVHSARQNRVIPLVLKNHTFVSGITSPRNFLYIQKLNKTHPQFRFKTVFIPFFDFKTLYKTLYTPKKSNAPCFSETSQPRFSQSSDLSLSENRDSFPLSEKNGPVLSEYKDLSLMMNFKTIIKNPKTDFPKISALYNRYENLQHLISHEETQDRFVLFNEFIVESHRHLTRTFKCPSIEFSLKQEKGKILISACPHNERI